MPISEFQAVILAGGRGSRYTELTTRKAKCLLPIGSKPMIWYPLQLLERNGFKEAYVIVHESAKSEVSAAIEDCGLNIVPNLLSIPADEDWGTVDSLKHFSDFFKSDLVVLSCDLLTNIDLHKVLNLYQKHNASLVTFMIPYTSPAALTIPGPKSKSKVERDVVGLDPTTNKLVLLASASDFEEEMTIKINLLKKHERISLFSKLLDSHLYIINQWVIKYLVHESSISTLKGELLPHIINKQNSRKNKTDIKSFQDSKDICENNIYHFAKEDNLATKIRYMSHFNDNKNGPYNNEMIRCYTYIASGNEMAIRANTLSEYYKINREIVEKFPDFTKVNDVNAISHTAVIESTQLDKASCIVGDESKIAEKTSIKNCVISSKCSIQTKTRLLDCIIMNGATVGELCQLTNCIICNGAVISNNCILKDCIVGSNYVVPANSNHSQEVLTDDDTLMEI